MQLKNKLITAGCIALAAATLLTGVACNEHELAPFSKSLSSGKKQLQAADKTRAVDILFVIDDSNSMVEEQQSLDSNFNKFLHKLIDANADFRLAAVSTSYTGSSMEFQTKALDKGANVIQNSAGVDVKKIKDKCAEYFVDKTWIDSKEVKEASEDSDEFSENIIDYFRCEAIMGTSGNGIEQGLATMRSALENAQNISNLKDTATNFKRPGSILAIVFVTDENDCSSDTNVGFGKDNAKDCELKRNIEDSCSMTREDRVVKGDNGSLLQLSKGQVIEYEGVKKTLREWCVQGDDTAREALEWCLSDTESCNASSYIQCKEGSCANELTPRRDYYDFLIKYVSDSNEAYYKSQNEEQFANLANAQEKKQLLETMAKSDIIIASIINRDQGIRYNDTLPENWCGTAGSQGYRYQLFAEMFDNDPIYAPICCKNENYTAGKNEAVCTGDKKENGQNGNFGPVLASIGQRIGEAVNTICATAVPITCKPSDCNGDSKNATCPCIFGCNTTPYFAGTDYEYYLCNEFEFKVGTLPESAVKSDNTVDTSKYKQYVLDEDYSIDYESSYCRARTGASIQINMIKSEPSTLVVFDYPKMVGN